MKSFLHDIWISEPNFSSFQKQRVCRGKIMKALHIAITMLLVTFVCHQSYGDIFMNFQGNAGSGLLPGNENPPVASPATGGEIGAGLVYDDVTNTLTMLFEFSDLSGGIDTSIGSGMHLHLAGDPNDPFGSNGGVAFNLNSGADPNVTHNSPLIANGATSGMVDVELVFTEAQEADLLGGLFYVNIHTADFGGGELRGNVVVIPEPASWSFVGLGVILYGVRRRKK